MKMKTLPIIGFILAAFLATAGTAAAGELDGKAIICGGNYIVFEEGQAVKHLIEGYSKTTDYPQNYKLFGTGRVYWKDHRGYNHHLDRQTLKLSIADNPRVQCRLSSKAEILDTLDRIIAAGKKKNKI
jgi:hypothetical protein